MLISSIVLGSAIDILMLRELLWHEKEQQARQLVESSFSVLTHFHDLQQQGELSEAAAQTAAIGTIKAMRYAEKEYFWLNDLGTPFPKMIMHPIMPALDGQILSMTQFNSLTGMRASTDTAFTIPTGQKNVFVAFSEAVAKDGQGYVTYNWPRVKNGVDFTDQFYPKLSFVKKFAPWGWVIGSGVYIDDVDAVVRQQVWINVMLVGGSGGLLLLFATFIARSITRPLQQTVTTMRAISLDAGSTGQRLQVDGRSEIAELASGFNDMLAHLEVRDAKLAQQRESLEVTVTSRTAELRESEEKFSIICSTAQDAIVMINSDCTISYWNLAAEKIFGHSSADAFGRELYDLLIPERYRAEFSLGFSQFHQSGEIPFADNLIELIGLHKNGSEFPVELSISAVHLKGQWAAVGFVRDISERKLIYHTVRESQTRMRALLDATSESVMLLAPDGQILAINTFAANRFGEVPGTITGKNFFDLLPPDLAVSRRALVRSVVTTGQAVHAPDRRGAVFFNNSLYPVKDESDAVESVAVYAKDVTEQHCAKAIDDILNNMEAVLLKWRMTLASIAQIFCDDILPVFELSAAWIGRAESDGSVTLLASAEGACKGTLNAACMNSLRWQGEPVCSLPLGVVMGRGTHQLVVIDAPDGQTDPAGTHNIEKRSAIVLPLALRGKTWGVLTLYGRSALHFEGDQLQARLASIASRLGGSLESALQQEWLSLLDTALAGVGNAVYITDASANILWANQALTLLSGFETEDVLGKTPRLFSSGVHDGDFFTNFWNTIQSGLTWRGDIVNVRRDGTRYAVSQTVTPLLDANGKVSHYVTILEDITQRKTEAERMQHSAQYDSLTDLPNRSLFFDRLEQALALWRRDRLSGALLFLDLDHFKGVNDQLGHAAGDELLIAVARRLREEVRESDTVARLGGDEFTVILPNLCDREDSCRVAVKIINALSQPFLIAGDPVTIGVSIGIALFEVHGASVERILNAADNAMYLAKNSGRNRYVVAQLSPAKD